MPAFKSSTFITGRPLTRAFNFVKKGSAMAGRPRLTR